MIRIDWATYAMSLAWMASMRSEARTISDDGIESARKVGCCVLGKDYRVLSMGYNGFTPGFRPPADFYKDPVKRVTHILHSETNALRNVKPGEAGMIAITLSPCAACAQQIVAYQIPKVLYGEEYRNTEGIDILHFYNVETIYLPLMTVMEEWIVPSVEEFLSPSKPQGITDLTTPATGLITPRRPIME